MGVRAGASLYDSVTGTVFGPVFTTIEAADAFLDWYNERDDTTEDLRLLTDVQVAWWVVRWSEETGQP